MISDPLSRHPIIDMTRAKKFARPLRGFGWRHRIDGDFERSKRRHHFDVLFEKAVVPALDNPIAGTRGLTQPALVQDLDAPTRVSDDVLLVEAARRRGDAAAPYPELGVRSTAVPRQVCVTYPVLGHQQPASEARVDAMESAANARLRDLHDQRVD